MAQDFQLRIERTTNPVEGDKRQKAPYISKWRCPDCGTEHEIDHRMYYFDYPMLGKPLNARLYLNCITCEEANNEGDKGSLAVTVDILVLKEGEVAVTMTEDEARLWKEGFYHTDEVRALLP